MFVSVYFLYYLTKTTRNESAGLLLFVAMIFVFYCSVYNLDKDIKLDKPKAIATNDLSRNNKSIQLTTCNSSNDYCRVAVEPNHIVSPNNIYECGSLCDTNKPIAPFTTTTQVLPQAFTMFCEKRCKIEITPSR